MAGGTWDPTGTLPVRPGLYINFVDAAIAQIKGGERGVVAMTLKNYGGATEDTVYEIYDVAEAEENFGKDNIQSIKFALQGGAEKVLVYTMPQQFENLQKIKEAFATKDFNVFCMDGDYTEACLYTDTNKSKIFADVREWVQYSIDYEGKYFMAVFGREDDTVVDKSSSSYYDNFDHDYMVQLMNGVVYYGKEGDTTYTSQQFSPYIAGLIAATPINKSITYARVPADNMNVHFTPNQIIDGLQQNLLALIYDGDKVKVERGITSSGAKIRSVRGKAAIADDILQTAHDSYIGQLDNSEDGRAALVSAIKAYLERLEDARILTDIEVRVDELPFKSVGDTVYLTISYTEIDSLERIFVTVNV
ncbi:phage tail sheath subtilisin-like domain-containing protein [Longirhabdus pacifica]|uniref:phage tail sheath subtilisin-like domain-containing protein n=1 Tax=Longirhabdus pacifica TaxID=2305227 RepID=UPI001008A1C5|nr:phage tail sheath subtilisin-like domain-containing protein [Longirhabdus pacifica]